MFDVNDLELVEGEIRIAHHCLAAVMNLSVDDHIEPIIIKYSDDLPRVLWLGGTYWLNHDQALFVVKKARVSPYLKVPQILADVFARYKIEALSGRVPTLSDSQIDTLLQKPDIQERLDLVVLADQIFGRAAAQEMWRIAELPDVGAAVDDSPF